MIQAASYHQRFNGDIDKRVTKRGYSEPLLIFIQSKGMLPQLQAALPADTLQARAAFPVVGTSAAFADIAVLPAKPDPVKALVITGAGTHAALIGAIIERRNIAARHNGTIATADPRRAGGSRSLIIKCHKNTTGN
jgi:hypothetical protein